MQFRVSFLLWAGLLPAVATHGGTIQYQLTNLGGSEFRYNYFLSGFAFNTNTGFDVRFDPALFGTLSNGVAGSGFSNLLLQPGNPPGTFGDYIAISLVNNPLLTGPFGADVLFKGSGQPGAQPFFVFQADASGNILSITQTGTTTLQTGTTIPEPGTWGLMMLSLTGGIVCAILHRYERRSGQ